MTRWGLGVDIGTSFSAGAVAAGDRAELLEIGGDTRIPSTVLLTEDGRLLAGTYAQRTVGQLPDRAERNPKRYVGRAPMLLGGEPVTAVDALAALLALFATEARRRHDGTEPARVVLTHPVAWTAAQRAELTEAATLVFPDVEVGLLAEPVAAAVHYVQEDDPGGPVAVYDLGGGTFDTAVLTADATGFRVVGRPGGDPDIGGEYFDQLVYRHFGEQLAHAAPDWWEQVGSNPERHWLAAAADLLTVARIAKEALSEHETASQYVPGADADVHVSRAELDALIGDDVRRTVRLLVETVAGADLRAVYLTGGASRTPLVEQAVRDQYDGLVRTRPDPKTVVALGAARWAVRELAVGARARVSREASPRHRPPPALVTIVDGVLDARVVGGAVYTWSAPDGQGGAHHIARVDPRSGRPDREIVLGRLVGWALSGSGVLVAERRGGELHCHALGPDLSIAGSAVLPTPYRPFLRADGGLAWAVLRSPDTRMVDGAAGLPPGEIGELAVQVFRLGTGPGVPAGSVVPLGPAAFWYSDPEHRMLDAAAPTTAVPELFGDGRSCGVVVGRPATVSPPGRALHPGPAAPRQSVLLIGPAGDVTAIAEQRAQGAGTPWVHQVLGSGGRWLLTTSVGLESYADLRHGTDRRLFLARPPAGAVRWIGAGRQAYGLAVDQVPARGLSMHVLVDGRRRELGRWPALLGSPTAVRADDAARVRADGEQILLGVDDGNGGSQLVQAGPGGARVLGSAPGWLEPVGRAAGAVLARHVPGAPPGDGCAEPGTLVRLPTAPR